MVELSLKKSNFFGAVWSRLGKAGVEEKPAKVQHIDQAETKIWPIRVAEVVRRGKHEKWWMRRGCKTGEVSPSGAE